MMIYIKWFILAVCKILLLLTVPFAAPIIAALNREQSHDLDIYNWGSIWGTYDNPPQGDEGFIEKRCWFPNVTTGFKGYLNRINWMIRNPLYGYAKLAQVEYSEDLFLTYVGNPDISDKYEIPGWYFSKVFDRNDKVIAFEFYCVLPWSKTRNLRSRLGWKVMTRKFEEYGFAQLVVTCNPFDGYGKHSDK